MLFWYAVLKFLIGFFFGLGFIGVLILDFKFIKVWLKLLGFFGLIKIFIIVWKILWLFGILILWLILNRCVKICMILLFIVGLGKLKVILEMVFVV